MGEKTWEGIYARKASILVYFRWNGRSYRETLKLDPTPKNLAYASRLRHDILRAVELGTFSIGDFFPDSKHAAKSDHGPQIEKAIDDYLDSRSRILAETTVREFRNTLKKFFADDLGKHLGAFDFATLNQRLANLEVSPKTGNNILSCLRGLYDYAVRSKWVSENPTLDIEFAKRADPEPDPLDRDEMEAVIADMAKHYHPQVANYFEGALWLGWRPSEGIALNWGNLDRRKGILRINAARVRGVEKTTKTYRARDVELDARGLALFERQREFTQLKAGRIFTNPVTGENWWDTSDLVQKYWRPSLVRLGIRDRDARQTRHTCATMLLMAGCNPAWCAAQLGHSVEMFLRVYSRWISGADKGRERAKLADFALTIHKVS